MFKNNNVCHKITFWDTLKRKKGKQKKRVDTRKKRKEKINLSPSSLSFLLLRSTSPKRPHCCIFSFFLSRSLFIAAKFHKGKKKNPSPSAFTIFPPAPKKSSRICDGGTRRFFLPYLAHKSPPSQHFSI